MNVCRTHSRAFSTMRLLEGRRSSCRLGNACASCWNLTFKDSLLARSIALCSALRSAFPVLNGKKNRCEKKFNSFGGRGPSYRAEDGWHCLAVAYFLGEVMRMGEVGISISSGDPAVMRRFCCWLNKSIWACLCFC